MLRDTLTLILAESYSPAYSFFQRREYLMNERATVNESTDFFNDASGKKILFMIEICLYGI